MCPTINTFLYRINWWIDIVVRLLRLHHIRRIPSTFLFNYRQTQIHVIINAILFAVVLYHITIGLRLFRDLCLIGIIFRTVGRTPGTNHSTNCTYNNCHQKNYKQHNPYHWICRHRLYYACHNLSDLLNCF